MKNLSKNIYNQKCACNTLEESKPAAENKLGSLGNNFQHKNLFICKIRCYSLFYVFESFRKTYFYYCNLDLQYHIKALKFTWDVILKMTGLKLKLFSGTDMHLIV